VYLRAYGRRGVNDIYASFCRFFLAPLEADDLNGDHDLMWQLNRGEGTNDSYMKYNKSFLSNMCVTQGRGPLAESWTGRLTTVLGLIRGNSPILVVLDDGTLGEGT